MHKPTPDEIAALKAEWERCKEAAKEADFAMARAQHDYMAARCSAHPWQPGTLLRLKSGATVKVVSVRRSWGTMIGVFIVEKKKNGEWGIREREVQAWDHPAPVEESA